MGNDTERTGKLNRRDLLIRTGRGAAALALAGEVSRAKKIEAGGSDPLSPDFDISSFNRNGQRVSQGTGHFYMQTRGEALFGKGFLVINYDAPVWDAYIQSGGRERAGLPLSNAFVDEDGLVCQLFEGGLMKVSPEGNFQWSSADTPIPPDVLVPNFSDYLPLSNDVHHQLFTGNSVEMWNQAASELGKPVWQMLISAQKDHIKSLGQPMTLPMVSDKEVWNVWAQEAKMEVNDLLLKTFFADAPYDGVMERQATTEINGIRSEYGLKPVTLNKVSVLACRAETIYGVVNHDMFINNNLTGLNPHEQLPDTLGFVGQWPWDRAKYFGAQQLQAYENGGWGNSVSEWLLSPPHKEALLKELPGVMTFGYAKARMGNDGDSRMIIGIVR